MASISDLIMQQVQSAAGGVQIPSNVQSQVLNGLSSSVLGSLTQTVAKPGGVDAITALLRVQTNAATSPVTKLAGNLFKTNILKNLNLGTGTNSALMALIPTVMGKLSNVIRDRDGDGDVDLNDIILSLKSSGSGAGAGVLGAATSILGGIFGRRKK
jgi:hypothetical protein